MGYATSYDVWQDPGLAFSDEQVDHWYNGGMLEWAIEQQERLLLDARILWHRNNVKVPLAGVSTRWAKYIPYRAENYGRAVDAKQINLRAYQEYGEETEPWLNGKALEIVDLLPWVEGFKVRANTAIQHCVSITRMCPRDSRQWRSRSNKVANACVQEVEFANRMLEEILRVQDRTVVHGVTD